MADKKISELDAITGAATAADDFFIVVDSSGSATKKISREELNNAIERDVLSTVDIDGGTIDGTTIGGSSAAAGTFTDLTVTGTVTGISTGISNVVEDTTPQLGGNLDLNGSDITGTGNINNTGTITTDGLTVDGASVFNQAASDQSGGAAVKANGTAYGTNKSIHAYMNTSSAAKSLIYAENGAGSVFNVDGAGDISFYDSTGVSQNFFWDSSASRLTLSSSDYHFGIQQGGNQAWYLRGVSDGSFRVHLNGTGDIVTATSSGNVGIGTATPTQKLSVAAPSALVDITSTTGTSFNGLEFKNSSGSFYIGQDNSTGTFYGAANARVLYSSGAHPIAFFTNGSNERLRITSDGNLQAGATSGRGGAATGHLFKMPSGDVYFEIMGSTTSANTDILFSDGTGGSYGVVGYDHTNDALRFFTNSGEKVRIDSSGYVGISTSSPQNELDVRGTVEIGNGSTQRMYLQGTGNDFRFYDRANLAERLRITASGDVGINTASPNVELEISGSGEMLRLQSTDTNKCSIKGRGSAADRWLLGTVASNDSVTLQATSATGELLFKTGGTNERMRIPSSGGLIVGDTAPPSGAGGVVQFFLKQSSSSNGIASIANANDAYVRITHDGSVGRLSTTYGTSAGYTPLVFDAGGAERMRVETNGDVAIGTNSPSTYLSGTNGLVVSSNFAGIAQRGTTHSQAWLSYVYLSGRYEWYNVTSSRTEAYLTTGGAFYNRSGTYGTISDSRLKQDIVDSGSQWDDIKALQVKKYRLNTDVEAEGENAPVMLGVIAQDLEAAGMNGLVEESLQASTDEDGNIIPSDEKYKTVKYSILYMKAVKALQEAMDRIETLEAKVAALEAN